MTRASLAVLAGLVLALVVVACGAAATRTAAPPTNTDGGAGSSMLPADPHARIEALDNDIRANLDRMGVEQPATMSVGAAAADPRPMAEIRGVCTPATPPPNETCGDICNLGNHICDNATQICELAAELQPDAWSQGKCDSGKKSCEAARKRCCECS